MVKPIRENAFILLGMFCLAAITVLVWENHILRLQYQSVQKQSANKLTPRSTEVHHEAPLLLTEPDKAEYTTQTLKKNATESVLQRKSPISKPTAVIIFTSMRSGSSFLGELFNQYKQVFYMFEPLHAFGSRKEQQHNRIKALSELSQCDFSNIPSMYKKSVVAAGNLTDRSALCAEDNFCFKYKSMFLSRDAHLCESPRKGCAVPFKPSTLSEICKRSLFPVFKIIAEPLLESLEPILEDSRTELRVIHLVRDPRAVMSSRKDVFSTKNNTYSVTTHVDHLCRSQERNLRFMHCTENTCSDELVPSKHWKGRYMRLRFEDVSARPFDVARQVYDFVGLNYHSSIEKWIEGNTKNESMNSNAFSTKRDSRQAIGRWRHSLSYAETIAVQKSCKDVMSALNYTLVNSEHELLNITRDLW